MAQAGKPSKSFKRVRVSGIPPELSKSLLAGVEQQQQTTGPKAKKPKTCRGGKPEDTRARILKNLRKLHQSGHKSNGLAGGVPTVRPSSVSCPSSIDATPLGSTAAEYVSEAGHALDGEAGSTSAGKGLHEICVDFHRRQVEIQREEAWRKIANMTDTAHFSDNLDSMKEFTDLLGTKPIWSIMMRESYTLCGY